MRSLTCAIVQVFVKSSSVSQNGRRRSTIGSQKSQGCDGIFAQTADKAHAVKFLRTEPMPDCCSSAGCSGMLSSRDGNRKTSGSSARQVCGRLQQLYGESYHWPQHEATPLAQRCCQQLRRLPDTDIRILPPDLSESWVIVRERK